MAPYLWDGALRSEVESCASIALDLPPWVLLRGLVDVVDRGALVFVLVLHVFYRGYVLYHSDELI